MSIYDLSDEDILIRLKELKKSSGTFSEDMRQYAEAIYNRYNRQGYNLCRYYGLNHNDAEDVMQDSFIRLFNYIQSYKEGKPFRQWFLKIIFNQVRSKYNEKKRGFFKDPDVISEIPETDEKNNIEKFQIRAYLNDIIDKAPKKLKEVLLLHVYFDSSFEEMAITLGISSRQARNRLKKAYAFLKSRVEN
jgi:RNA polymerase sigma-70 factor (ECF subfamily)